MIRLGERQAINTPLAFIAIENAAFFAGIEALGAFCASAIDIGILIGKGKDKGGLFSFINKLAIKACEA